MPEIPLKTPRTSQQQEETPQESPSPALLASVLGIVFALILLGAVAFLFRDELSSLISTDMQDSTLSEVFSDDAPVSYIADASERRFLRGAELIKVNQQRGIALLKELAGDEKATPFFRAQAITFLARSIYYLPEEVFVGEVLDNGKWQSIYREEEGDVNNTLLGIYRWSTEVHPTTQAQQSIVLWYLGELQNNEQLTSIERDEYLRTARAESKKITLLFERQFVDSPMSLFDLRGFYLAQGMIDANFFYLTDSEETRRSAERSFERALQLDAFSGSGMAARYRFASLLQQSEGESARSRIEGLLHPLVVMHQYDPSITVYNELKRRAGGGMYQQQPRDGGTDITAERIAELGQFYQPFADLLVSLGWQQNVVNAPYYNGSYTE